MTHLDTRTRPQRAAAHVGVTMLVITALCIGLGGSFFLAAAEAASRSIMNPQTYVSAVLGEDMLDAAGPVTQIADP